MRVLLLHFVVLDATLYFFLSGKNDFRTSDSLFKQDPLVTVSRGAKGDGKGCGMPERKGQRGVRLVLSRSWSAPS
jgi:hypothetical protein